MSNNKQNMKKFYAIKKLDGKFLCIDYMWGKHRSCFLFETEKDALSFFNRVLQMKSSSDYKHLFYVEEGEDDSHIPTTEDFFTIEKYYTLEGGDND
jgi:hypothetical protein